MSDKARDARAYILAATICLTADLSSVREEVTGLRLKGQRKVHWRDESDKRRRTITECIALLPLEHVVVVRAGHPADCQERRRRHAMERLLHELDRADVKEVTFESRDSRNDSEPETLLIWRPSRRGRRSGLSRSNVSQLVFVTRNPRPCRPAGILGFTSSSTAMEWLQD
jgi:hypothetical protein